MYELRTQISSLAHIRETIQLKNRTFISQGWPQKLNPLRILLHDSPAIKSFEQKFSPNAPKIKSFPRKYKPIVPEIEFARREGRLETEIENGVLPPPDPDHIQTHGPRLPSNRSLRRRMQTATHCPPTRNPHRAAAPSSSPAKTAPFSGGEAREEGGSARATTDEVRRRRERPPLPPISEIGGSIIFQIYPSNF